ncbi:MAG: UDP-N-acetylmuramoyl-L-alanine--D-glutamate ligase [Acidimicrobiia bacterium]
MLVLGAGVSGMAAARLARSRGMTVGIYAGEAAPEAISEGFAVAAGSWDPILLEGVDLVVASPGFSERSAPIVDTLERGLPLWSEIELAWRHLRSPVAAVTGTNGKTTVTEMTSAMLESSGLKAPATGNIGAPLSEFADQEYDALVVEVSSFQLRFIEQFHPVAAAITNVAVDHLDWHGSVYSYREAKRRIYENQDENDLLVYDADDDGATDLARGASSRLIPASGQRLPAGGVGVEEGTLVVGETSIEITELASHDPTHLANLACAGVLALEMGANAEGVTRGALEYRPGAHRRSLVLRVNGVSWVDDSKATNPHAAVASIRAHQSVVLIAGGLSKGLDLRPIAAEPGVKMLLGIGEAGPALVEMAGERGRLAGTLETAVAMAKEVATPDDTVLLAPGCASFDQFNSYGTRGERFVELVNETVKERSG